MSRPYKMTDAHREELVRDFRESMMKNPITGGTLTYTKTLSCGRATILFTPVAYLKQAALVRETESEIGWHGIVHRSETDPRVFIVEDIVVYPQKVTGTSINPDQGEYNTWQDSFDDDTFNAMRFHGHSHVNMGVFSSSVDDGYQEDLIKQLAPDMFQIFMILNKSGKHWQRIVDLQQNVVFDTSDIDIGLTECSFDYVAFLADAKSKLKPDTSHVDTAVKSLSGSSQYHPNGWSYQTQHVSKAEKQVKPVEKTAKKTPAYTMYQANGYYGIDGLWHTYDEYPNGTEDDYYEDSPYTALTRRF